MDINPFLDKCKLNEFVAIDLETTGLSPKEEFIIEVSAVRFINGTEHETFSFLLNPGKPIPSFIEDLTGISNSMVSGKPSFIDILDDFVKFVGKSPVIGHNVKFDIDIIKYHSNNKIDLSKTNLICDSYLLSKIVLFSNEEHSLEAISEFYDLPIKGSHRALNDARNSGLVIINLIEQLSTFNKDLLLRIKNIFLNREIPNSIIFDNIIDCLDDKSTNFKFRSARKSFYKYKSNKKSSIPSLDEIAGKDGYLYSDSKYEFREPQFKMMQIIQADIHNDNLSIIEAGTGLGKTYAYLLPFILESIKNDIPLIISTYTKSLQDQLFFKDLKYILDFLDIDSSALLLKGRNNYICPNRLANIEFNSFDLIRDFECHDLATIVAWSSYTNSGDIDECSSFSTTRSSRLWNLIKSEARFCQKKCGHSGPCYYTQNTDLIKKSTIIVVNHALLISDAIDNRNLLPNKHLFVIDEAHDLFKSAKDILTSVYDKTFFNNYLNDIVTITNKIIDNDPDLEIINFLDLIKETIANITSFYDSYLVSKDNDSANNSSYPSISIYDNLSTEFQDCMPTLDELIDNLKELQNKFVHFNDNESYNERFRKLGLIDLISQFSDQIDIFIESSNSDRYLSWVKYFHKNNTCSINHLYKDIGIILYEKFFSNNNPGLLCSATLTVDNSFDYFVSKIGLDNYNNDQEINKLILSSPFFLEDQVDFYTFKSDIDINSNEYIENVSNQIFEISNFFNKRMLILCTSYKQASQIKNKLKPKFSKFNKRLLVHEKGRSRNSLIRAYKSSKSSVLIGTMAFWEGIDLPGDELSILMMLRIPFSNPNEPYMRYLNNQISSIGENSFSKLQVPSACLKMKQGFGRLIRTEYDSGIFIITDPRIHNSRYGHKILNSFPIESQPYNHFSTILNNKKIL